MSNSTFLPISNNMVVNAIQSSFDSLGIQTVGGNRPEVLQGKAKLAVSYTLADSIEVNGDKLHFSLGFRNANDGGTAFTMHLGFFRVICSNGLVIGVGDALRIIHRNCNKSRTAIDQLPELIQSGLERRGEIINTVEELQGTSYLDPISIIGNLSVTDAVKKTAIRVLLNPREGLQEARPDLFQPNAWSLGNLVNESIRSVHGRSFTAINQNKTLFEDVLTLAQDQVYQEAI